MNFPLIKIITVVLLFVVIGCAYKTIRAEGNYPPHWWTPVTDANPPAWEILPQAAKPGEVILSKRNELGILSNFARTPFEYRGKHYESIEGFWQMMLYPENASDWRALDKRVQWKYTREQVSQMVGFEAKAAGELAEQNMRILGIDWVSFEEEHFPYRSAEKGRHYTLIREAMTEKLRQNPKVKEILKATGSLILRPDHHEEPNAPAEWRYFDVWMELRSTLSSVSG